MLPIRSNRVPEENKFISINRTTKQISELLIPDRLLCTFIYNFTLVKTLQPYEFHLNNSDSTLNYLSNIVKNTCPTVDMILVTTIYFSRIFNQSTRWALSKSPIDVFTCCLLQAIKLLHPHHIYKLVFLVTESIIFNGLENQFLERMRGRSYISDDLFRSYKESFGSHLLTLNCYPHCQEVSAFYQNYVINKQQSQQSLYQYSSNVSCEAKSKLLYNHLNGSFPKVDMDHSSFFRPNFDHLGPTNFSKRLSKKMIAPSEIPQANYFDYRLINNDVLKLLDQLPDHYNITYRKTNIIYQYDEGEGENESKPRINFEFINENFNFY